MTIFKERALSSKGKKPCPRAVYYEGTQSSQIEDFLENRKLVKDFISARINQMKTGQSNVSMASQARNA